MDNNKLILLAISLLSIYYAYTNKIYVLPVIIVLAAFLLMSKNKPMLLERYHSPLKNHRTKCSPYTKYDCGMTTMVDSDSGYRGMSENMKLVGGMSAKMKQDISLPPRLGDDDWRLPGSVHSHSVINRFKPTNHSQSGYKLEDLSLDKPSNDCFYTERPITEVRYESNSQCHPKLISHYINSDTVAYRAPEEAINGSWGIADTPQRVEPIYYGRMIGQRPLVQKETVESFSRDLYDPRNVGHPAQSERRDYFDVMSGTTKFVYDDLHQNKAPTVLSRHKLDVFDTHDSYGETDMDCDQLRLHAQNMFIDKTNNFRTTLQEEMMRKNNASLYQAKQAPFRMYN